MNLGDIHKMIRKLERELDGNPTTAYRNALVKVINALNTLLQWH